MPSRAVVCCDNFKGTATALEVNDAIARGLSGNKTNSVSWTVDSVPMTDGGAGFLNALFAARPDLERVDVANVIGPLGEPLEFARYAYDGSTHEAFIEMAAASGIELITEAERDPFAATTYGFGQLILHAIAKGATTLYLGLGGSATNDGGIGLLQALGLQVHLAGASATRRYAGGWSLEHVTTLGGADAVRERLVRRDGKGRVAVELVTDVTNILCGPEGATAIYGPQKGVRREDVRDLDEGMQRYGVLLSDLFGTPAAITTDGAGAAGGCGAALIAVGAKPSPGAQTFANIVQLVERMTQADIVISGEGKFDSQTLSYGKTVACVAQCALAASKLRVARGLTPLKVVVVCGRSQVSDADALAAGVHRVISLTPQFSVHRAMTETKQCIVEAVEARRRDIDACVIPSARL